MPAEIDTEVLTRRIEELNFIAEKQRIVNKNGQHQFHVLLDVEIMFYKNGLMIEGGFPFYPYHSKEAQSMLSDILDGYFPYDLKKKYPEGVPLKPVDRTDDMYVIKDVIEEKKLLITPIVPKKTDQTVAPPKKEVDVQPIRDELEKKFRETHGQLDLSKLNSNEPIIVQTEVSKNETEYTPTDIVTLRVRTETGKRTLILKFTI